MTLFGALATGADFTGANLRVRSSMLLVCVVPPMAIPVVARCRPPSSPSHTRLAVRQPVCAPAFRPLSSQGADLELVEFEGADLSDAVLEGAMVRALWGRL